MVIKLWHPTDPRYLLLNEPLPDRISPDDLFGGRYGKPLLFEPAPADAVYEQPAGFGTDWLRPD